MAAENVKISIFVTSLEAESIPSIEQCIISAAASADVSLQRDGQITRLSESSREKFHYAVTRFLKSAQPLLSTEPDSSLEASLELTDSFDNLSNPYEGTDTRICESKVHHDLKRAQHMEAIQWDDLIDATAPAAISSLLRRISQDTPCILLYVHGHYNTTSNNEADLCKAVGLVTLAADSAAPEEIRVEVRNQHGPRSKIEVTAVYDGKPQRSCDIFCIVAVRWLGLRVKLNCRLHTHKSAL